MYFITNSRAFLLLIISCSPHLGQLNLTVPVKFVTLTLVDEQTLLLIKITYMLGLIFYLKSLRFFQYNRTTIKGLLIFLNKTHINHNMGGKIKSLPVPPRPRRNILNLFSKDKPHSEVFKIPNLPASKKKDGFVIPRNLEHEAVERRQFEQIANLRRKVDHDTRERQNFVKETEKELSQKETELSKKEKELNALDKTVISNKKYILRLRSEVNNKINSLEEREKALKEREKIIAGSEIQEKSDLVKLERKLKVVKNDLDILLPQKEALKIQIEHKRSELEEIEQNTNNKIEALKYNEKLLAMREDEIIKTVRRLEEERDLLDKKEDEIINRIEKLEEDQNLLQNKEDEIIRRIHNLEKLKEEITKKSALIKETEIISLSKIKEIEITSLLKIKNKEEDSISKSDSKIAKLKDKENTMNIRIDDKKLKLKLEEDHFKEKKKILDKLETELHKKEIKINHSKELKENQKRLEKIYSDLTKKYTTLKTDYLKGLDLYQKEHQLVDFKNELLTKEKVLRAIDEKLKQRKHSVDDLEFRNYFTKQTFDSGFPDRPKDISINVSTSINKEKIIVKNNDIFSLIENTKMLIEKGLIRDAKYNIPKIRSLFSQLELVNDDKNAVYYDILELENAIEISEL